MGSRSCSPVVLSNLFTVGSNVREQRELSDGERRHRANCSGCKLRSFSVSRSRSHGSISQHLTTMIVPPKLSSDRWTLSGPRVARNSKDRHTKFLQKTMEPEQSGVHQYLNVFDDSSVTNTIVCPSGRHPMSGGRYTPRAPFAQSPPGHAPAGTSQERRFTPLIFQVQGRSHTPQGAAEGLAREVSQLCDTSARVLRINAAAGSHLARRASQDRLTQLNSRSVLGKTAAQS